MYKRQAAYVALKDVVGERDITNMCGMLETADALAVPCLLYTSTGWKD